MHADRHDHPKCADEIISKCQSARIAYNLFEVTGELFFVIAIKATRTYL